MLLRLLHVPKKKHRSQFPNTLNCYPKCVYAESLERIITDVEYLTVAKHDESREKGSVSSPALWEFTGPRICLLCSSGMAKKCVKMRLLFFRPRFPVRRAFASEDVYSRSVSAGISAAESRIRPRGERLISSRREH